MSDAHAKLTLLEYGDYVCPACILTEPLVQHLLFAQSHHLTPAALAGYAQSLGLDIHRFNAEMADRIDTQRIQEHRRAGVRSGLRAIARLRPASVR